jgi:hypothetical protein
VHVFKEGTPQQWNHGTTTTSPKSINSPITRQNKSEQAKFYLQLCGNFSTNAYPSFMKDDE